MLARVYTAKNGSHWRGRRGRLVHGSWAMHVAAIVLTLLMLPVALLVFATTRWLLVPLLERLDVARGRFE